MTSELDRRIAELDIVMVERAMIGGILIDGGPPFPPLLPSEFQLEAHRILWGELCDMHANGDPITTMLVHHRLEQRGLLEVIGGPAALAYGLLEGCIEVHRMRYAQLIRDAARRRTIRQLGLQLAEQGLPEEEIQTRLAALPGPLAPNLYDAVETMDRIIQRWDQLLIPSGIASLDRLTGGLVRGQVVLLAGITSHGKTALACHLAHRIARARHRVDYITLEETADGITRRLAAAITGMSAYRILTGGLGPQERIDLANAALYLRSLPLRITGPGSTLRSLQANAILGVASQSDAEVVIVDHMQKIQTEGDSRAYGLEGVMNNLHLIGLRDNKIILVTTQVSRTANSERRVPRESDLRDSGALEMFARQIWVGYWPNKHHSQRPPDEYELHVLKNSEGPTGLVPLMFSAHTGSFTDLD